MDGRATRTAPVLAALHRRSIRGLERLTINGRRTLAAIVVAPCFSPHLPEDVIHDLFRAVWSIQDFTGEIVYHRVISIIETLECLLLLMCNGRHQGLVTQGLILL